MVTVFDAFSYWRNSERWAIEARHCLWQTHARDVEYVMVACIGDRTHRGNPLPDGPPETPDWVERLDITLDAPSDWGRDEQQRDAIYGHLHGRATPDDLVIIGDADEIVDPRALPVLAPLVAQHTYVRVAMHLWMVTTEWRNTAEWTQTLIMPGDQLPPNVSRIRRELSIGHTSTLAGWHLSYYGSDELISQKLGAFAHAEVDNEGMRTALSQIRRQGAAHMTHSPLQGPLAEFLACYHPTP